MNDKTSKIIIITASCSVLIFLFVAVFYLNKNLTSNPTVVEIKPIELISKIDGTIEEINFDKGSTVKKDDILIRLDEKEYVKILEEKKALFDKEVEKSSSDDLETYKIKTKSSYKEAKIQLDNANADYVRYKNAFKDGTVTKKDLSKAENNLEIAKKQYEKAKKDLNIINSKLSKKNSQNIKIKKLLAEVENAKLNLSYTTIVSPIYGFIVEKNVEQNSIIKKDQKLASIIPFETVMKAEFSDVSKIKKGQKAKIKIGSKLVKGKVENIENKTVEIRFQNDIRLTNSTKAIVKIKVH